MKRVATKRRLFTVVKEEPPVPLTDEQRHASDDQIDWSASLWSIAGQGWHRINESRSAGWVRHAVVRVPGLTVEVITQWGRAWVRVTKETA